jgi:MFS family permease
MQGKLRGIHYGWIVIGATFVTLLLGAGVRSTPGILMVPFEEEFHWSRSTISFAVAVNLVIYGLIGPFAAAMMERFGVRRLMLAAIACIGTGVALTVFMHESWQLVLLWGVVVGCGTGTTANVLGVTVATRWFTKNRGLVVGILTSAAAAGQLVFLPVLAAIVTSFGWRAVVVTITGFAIAIFPLVAYFMRDRPEDIGIAPFGESVVAPRAAQARGNPVGTALRTLGEGLAHRDFWLLALSFFICGASTNGLIATHLIPACLDNGVTELTGASMLALIGAFNFAGATTSGWLSDRVDNRVLLAIYYSLRGLSLLLPAVLLRLVLRPVDIFNLLWARLDRHGAADGAADGERLRQGKGRHSLRLDFRVAPARQRSCRLCWWRHADRSWQLPGDLHPGGNVVLPRRTPRHVGRRRLAACAARRRRRARLGLPCAIKNPAFRPRAAETGSGDRNRRCSQRRCSRSSGHLPGSSAAA